MDELRFSHDIKEDDYFFIIGGHEGYVSDVMIGKYSPNVWIFEPSKKWYEFLTKKYENNKKVKIFNFGFGKDNKEEKLFIHGNGDGSSLYQESSTYEMVKIVKFSDFLSENQFKNIKLIEFNCEGAEYEIFKDLNEYNYLDIFEIIQVQFHRIYGYESLYNDVNNILSKTHNKTYGSFIWDFWNKK